MTGEVYRHLWQTFGQSAGWWFGIAAELSRTFLLRTVSAIVIARLATHVAAGETVAAQHDILWFLALNVAGASIGVAGDLVSLRAENTVYGRMAKAYNRRLTGKDMSFYRDHQTGYLTSLFRQYLDGFMLLARLIKGDIARTVISLAAPVVVLWLADPRIGLVSLAVIVLQVAYVMWSSTVSTKYRVLSNEIYRKVTGEVADTLTNIVAFKSSGMEHKGHSRVDRLTDQETSTFWHRRKIGSLLDWPRNLITAGGAGLAFWLIVSSGSGDSQSIGLIVLTLTYMFQLLRTVSDIPNIVLQHDDHITKGYPTLAYLQGAYETITDPAKPRKLRISKGAITIDAVDFGYPARSQKSRDIAVFNQLNIRIAGGEHVGVVGLSGAGKSTLASLLMRFNDVTGGSIRIDGIDIRTVRQSDLRRHIAYVPQEPLLFHRSIRENIAYYHETARDTDIIKAAKAAHAHEFISKLPDGYDTIVGERGLKLSGGQKQRVVIARAILKNAPIIIFDEATSALDSESESIIHQALPRIIGKHTAVVIAHRLSTIAGMDRIIVMHDGTIAEQGTHQELLDLKGRYHALWLKQTRH